MLDEPLGQPCREPSEPGPLRLTPVTQLVAMLCRCCSRAGDLVSMGVLWFSLLTPLRWNRLPDLPWQHQRARSA